MKNYVGENMRRGKIIVIEGTECSGKETQTSLIVQRLKREGKKVEHLAFPMYDTPTGKIVGGPYLGKEYISNSYFKEDIINVDPKVAALYYAADRRYNLKTINEFLDDGYDLIIDRYVESNMAHQGCKISNKEERFKLYKWFATLEYDLLELPRPNLTILLHMPYKKTMELKRVVVTGLGALTPVGNTVPEFWNNLINGVSGAGPITHFDASKFKSQFACEVKNFNVNDFIDRKEARKMDLYTQYAIVAAKEAVADANIDVEKEDLNKIGVIYGVGIGGLHTFEEEVLNYAQTKDTIGPRFSPFFIPKMIADIAAGHISMIYGFHGPNFTTTSACASSSNAIGEAFNLIRLGKANIILAGGAEATIYPAGVGGFNSMNALSTRNDDPTHASRPFSASRDGFVMGEGSGCLILEELEHAKARGAKIYAEIAGTGASADAYHITASHPEGLGAKLVMSNALEDAGMKPEDIDYINVHGTSTPVGDISEVKAIQALFGDYAYQVNISSTKSMTGHLLGAAGAVEAIACVLSVKNDIVPPTINHEEGDNDEHIDYNLNFTFNKAQQRTIRAALSNTFGFGGHNACVIVKKYAE